MTNAFFERPILNSPYEHPRRHWELDEQGQPTQRIVETCRESKFITPIPKPKKRKAAASQTRMIFDEGKGLSTAEQEYEPTPIINEVRQRLEAWRALPNPNGWQVTPETVRLLQHWLAPCYDAHSADFSKLGRIPVLRARMNADLHMSDELKNTGKGNLFVIFGEPDIQILKADKGEIQVKVFGVDVFDPTTGEVRSDSADGIACWFIDTDYNEESFFVRQAYFLGANPPYSALKTTLKAEIDEEAWATLHSDTSRPFPKPQSGRIAVKVINHLGDEIMKVFRVAEGA